jgi:hypothetical protein
MKKGVKNLVAFVLLTVSIGFIQGCKNKNPSIAKIYTRSNSNELLSEVKVVIIGDVDSDPVTFPHVDTLFTNASGFAEFNMDDYFVAAGEENTVGYFDIIIKKDGKQGEGRIRCRAHNTAVETVTLPD